jgi:hypothetical protein
MIALVKLTRFAANQLVTAFSVLKTVIAVIPTLSVIQAQTLVCPVFKTRHALLGAFVLIKRAKIAEQIVIALQSSDHSVAARISARHVNLMINAMTRHRHVI